MKRNARAIREGVCRNQGLKERVVLLEKGLGDKEQVGVYVHADRPHPLRMTYFLFLILLLSLHSSRFSPDLHAGGGQGECGRWDHQVRGVRGLSRLAGGEGGREGGGREERRKLTYLSNNRSKRMLLLSQHSTTPSIAKKMMTAPRSLLRPVLEGA